MKLQLLVFTVLDCHQCRALQRSRAVSRLQSKYWLNYIPYNADAAPVRALAERLRVHKYPTVLLLSPEGVELARVEGPASPSGLERAFLKHLPAPRKLPKVKRGRNGLCDDEVRVLH